MSDENLNALVGVLVVGMLIIGLIWSSGSDNEAYSMDVTMPDGSVNECVFVGYGKNRTLLECEKE